MPIRIVWLALVALFVLHPLAARANVTWYFEGIIRTQSFTTDFAPDLEAAGVDVGAPISGFFVLDPTVPDTNALSTSGTFTGAVVDVEMSVGSLVVTDTGGFFNSVSLALDRGHDDADFHYIQAVVGANYSDPPDLQFAFIELLVEDLSTIADDSFPVLPQLADLHTFDDLFPAPWLTSVGFNHPGGLVRAEITLLTPEPSTALLLGIGIVGLAIRRRVRA